MALSLCRAAAPHITYATIPKPAARARPSGTARMLPPIAGRLRRPLLLLVVVLEAAGVVSDQLQMS